MAPRAGAPYLFKGFILKYFFLESIFALYKDKGWSTLSPWETNNSRIPSLSISATAAPVPYPFFSNAISNATGVAEVGDAANVMKTEMEKMKTDLPQILSDTVYITENFSEEITSINEVEGEVQPIIQVAGVRG